MINATNINKKFELIAEYWTPKIIGELNGQHVKLAKIKDELIWHSHQDEDEMFIVFKGTLIMDFRNETTRDKRWGDINYSQGGRAQTSYKWRRSLDHVN
jgi:mannose-6-phosphate isomerase-like protein (cupin superfamily)